MKENERKCKRAGIAERFPPINFIQQQKKSPFYSDAWDLNTAQSQAKYQNNQKQQTITRTKWEERRNKSQKVKKQHE